jgi:protein ImuA
MQYISCHNGQIFTSAAQWSAAGTKSIYTDLPAIDELLSHGLARGAIHEVLWMPRHPVPKFFALLMARAAAGVIVWCDPRRTLYPPAVAAAGIPLEKLFLLHPQNQREQSWAVTECMRCKGVSATIAQMSKLSRIEARRLQLAAEKGGGIGILLRPMDRHAEIYAAATRWLVAPAPGLRTVQRWKIQLIHAHGGRVGNTVILEHHRETNTLRAAEPLGDRQSDATKVA